MVGRYPLTNPDEAEGRTHLRRLVVEAGVSTFVCLQSEVPPQTEVTRWPAGGVKVRGRCFLLYARLAQQFAPGRQLHFLHEPLDDLTAPGLAQVEALTSHLEERIRAGETVLVHCAGGRGRSGVVAACLLARLYGFGGEEVLQLVQAGYDSRQHEDAPSPETEQQRRLVRDFCTARAPGS